MSKPHKSPDSRPQTLTQEKIIGQEQVSLSTRQKNESLTFSEMMSFSPEPPELTIFKIRYHAINEFDKCIEELKIIIPQIENSFTKQQSSETITDFLDLLTKRKNLLSDLISWLSVIVNITDCELEDDNKNLSERELFQVKKFLIYRNELLDNMLIKTIHPIPVVGIPITVNQKDVSDVKSIIARVTTKLEDKLEKVRRKDIDYPLPSPELASSLKHYGRSRAEQIKINQKGVEMLRQWREEKLTEEELKAAEETWENVKKLIDENRFRKLFS